MANKRFTEEEVRQRKNARQREYAKKTNYISGANYNKEHSRNINFRLFTPKDNDIIEYLDTISKKAEYFRELIRADIQRSKED